MLAGLGARTTGYTPLNIDDQLLLSAKHRAVERGVSLASIIEEALRQSLAQPVQAQERKPIRLITASGSGVKPMAFT
jgi:hypothetical protein